MRPSPAGVGSNACVQTPCSVAASWTRTCSCWAPGKASMIRSTVLGALAVDLVDQGRQRRRLTGARRAGDQDEAARLLGQRVQRAGDAELLERLDVGGDQAESCTERAALEEDVDAEARQARNRVREVDLAVDLELLLLLRREDAVEHLVRVLGCELRGVLIALQRSVHAHGRRRADRDVQV